MGVVGHTLVLALGRQRKTDFCLSKASSWTARATQGNPVFLKEKKKKKRKGNQHWCVITCQWPFMKIAFFLSPYCPGTHSVDHSGLSKRSACLFLPNAGNWLLNQSSFSKKKIIILSKRSQPQKTEYDIVLFRWSRGKSLDIKSSKCRNCLGLGSLKVALNGHRFLFLFLRKTLKCTKAVYGNSVQF